MQVVCSPVGEERQSNFANVLEILDLKMTFVRYMLKSLVLADCRQLFENGNEQSCDLYMAIGF